MAGDSRPCSAGDCARSASARARGPTTRSSSTGTRRGCRAKERLAWYAEHFSTVEVDSTFYRVPDEAMVQGWADRTPPGFVIHVKAFGLMTRHPVRLEQLPPDLRDGMPRRRARPRRPAAARAARASSSASSSTRSSRCGEAGKLGGILFQLPPYVVPKPVVVRLPRVGARPARRRRDAGRVPPPRLVRGGAPRRGARAGSRSGGCRT